ncbi:hypothetical protein [Salibacterium sp. K-3]
MTAATAYVDVRIDEQTAGIKIAYKGVDEVFRTHKVGSVYINDPPAYKTRTFLLLLPDIFAALSEGVETVRIAGTNAFFMRKAQLESRAGSITANYGVSLDIQTFPRNGNETRIELRELSEDADARKSTVWAVIDDDAITAGDMPDRDTR